MAMMIPRRLFVLLMSACALQMPVLADTAPSVDVMDEAATMELSLQKAEQSELPVDEVAPAANSADPANDKTVVTGPDPVIESFPDDETIAQQRRLFLEAEVAIDNGDDEGYFLLADQLEDYPLYSYLQYQWLVKHLDHDRQIEYFLEQYSSTRYAPALKQRWLYQLAKTGQWPTFLQVYSDTRDVSMQCYYRRAQLASGDTTAALTGARELWQVGYSQPVACDPLFTEFEKSSLFTADVLWHRFDAALNNNKTRLASYLRKRMSAADQVTAGFWLQLHRNPEQYLPELLHQPWSAQSRRMFLHAIDRLANSDIHSAIAIWDKNKRRYNISTLELNEMEKMLAFTLAHDNDATAYERLGRLGETDMSSKTMRIRLALSAQDWPRVITAIKTLSPENQALEKWQYWLARAYQETAKPLQAEDLLSALADKRDFYGYLAADSVNRNYQLADKPIQVTTQEIADIEHRDSFRAAFELMVLDRDKDAKRQWWHALRYLNKNQYPAAAKLAQKWRWDDVAIFTIAKVKQWDDIAMRFPLSYADKIQENAELQDVNPVILFGLVRRESAFNKDARSPSGAQGLMQIMPQTGRQIAMDLDESRPGHDELYDPIKNLQYGSYYYQKLLNQFDGHYAIALAAYNAGPNRVKKWLPQVAMPADIWIETIPYRETRDYVTSVLVYAMIYQQRMRTTEFTMRDFIQEVPAVPASELTMNNAQSLSAIP